MSRLVLRLSLLSGAIVTATVLSLSPRPDTAEAVLPVVAPTTGWVTQSFAGCDSDANCHAAIDIAGPPTLPGNPVYAMASGAVIKRVQQSNGYGCHIVIDHGNQGDGRRLYSLYSHLGWKDGQGVTQGCYFSVSLGQSVARGQKIGNQGNSGLATGTHLHFATLLYAPPWSGSHHQFDPRQCIGFADQYAAGTPGPGCGPGTCPHDLDNGCILKALPSGRQYVFFGGAKFRLPSLTVRNTLYGNTRAWDVSDLYVDSLTQTLPKDGTLLRDSSDGKVYVVAGGARLHVPTPEILRSTYCPLYPAGTCAGLLWHSAVAGIATTIKDGTSLLDVSNGQVSIIVGGARFHVPNPTVMKEMYCPEFPQPQCYVRIWHQAVEAITTRPRDRTVIRDASNGKVHVVFGGARFHVPDEPTLKSLYCPAYPQPGCWRQLWHEAAEGLPTTPVDNATLREQPSSAVFSFCQGKRWAIPSPAVFSALGYEWSRVGILWAGALNFSLGVNTDVRVAAPGDRSCDPVDADDDNDALIDLDETSLYSTDPLRPDSDSDSVPDAVDNCPTWLNAAQGLPPWPVTPIDSDCDGFTSVAEGRLGTVATVHCAATPTPDDETADAWPPDLNDDQNVDTADLERMRSAYNSFAGSPAYSARLDMTGDGRIDVADLTIVARFYGKGCN